MNGNSLRVVCSFQKAPAEELQKLVLEYFSRFSKYHIESLHCKFLKVIGTLVVFL